MKVIFLDIDGVLNSTEYFERNQNIKGIESEIDVKKIELLKKAIDETGAKIVLSSTWRYMQKFQDLEELLSHYGIAITDVTPFLGDKRGLEITQWLTLHSENVEDFIILDDEKFRSYDQKLIKKLIKMSEGVDDDGYVFCEGLLPKDVDEIIKRLGKQKENEHEDFER